MSSSSYPSTPFPSRRSSASTPHDEFRIGNISYRKRDILGNGSEGTTVYRGRFDGRDVAVKRVLRERFVFAERELRALRESDEHPNVIRYFCTERDENFLYIALELCSATLDDYVKNENGILETCNLKPLQLLEQASSGLAHLHALDIVHRDIKPSNILLSTPNALGEVKAMISDFSLSKKLTPGRASFSRHSGTTGTDGWIAPEMISLTSRTTSMVDLFPLGCVFYYVLSNGFHPFGDSVKRQGNIVSGESSFTNLDTSKWSIGLLLIQMMTCPDADQRPSIRTVLIHPLFWTNEQVLAFFLDVSDRLEKSRPIPALEENSESITHGNWLKYITEDLRNDLCSGKFRTYNGKSVKDLIRAIRNKKNHYHELPVVVTLSLQGTTNEFVTYFTSRFPGLLIHAYYVMQCCRHEPTFNKYYDQNYLFPY